MTQMFLLPTAASGTWTQSLLEAKALFSDFLQQKNIHCLWTPTDRSMQSQHCISSRFESFMNRCEAWSKKSMGNSGKHWVQTKSSWNWRNNWKDTFLLKCYFWEGEQQWSSIPGRFYHLHSWRFTTADQTKLWVTGSGLMADPALRRRSDLALL